MSMNREPKTSSTETVSSVAQASLPLLGRSAAMKRVLHLAAKVAPTDIGVLITGETGTGKELLARAIHALSRRVDKPFVAVNTSAIPEALQESELFGHRKGAFTDAKSDRRGLFEEASGGTLFLDEIGDTSLSLQVKLLRALESGSVRRVGESAERPVDVRVIAATNRLLGELVQRGEFREDLFFRLNVVHLHLPPLRERAEDIEMLLRSNLERWSRRHQKQIADFEPEAKEALLHYFYPGNIRELENIIQHAVLMSEDALLRLKDLPPYMQGRLGLPAPSRGGVVEVPSHYVEPAHALVPSNPVLSLDDSFQTLQEMEKQWIEATLSRLKRNQSTAAKKLGVSRSTLWRKMKDYGIQP